MSEKKRSAAEIIAFNFSTDIRDIQDYRYQSTRYTSPAVYSLDNEYYCCPAIGQKIPVRYIEHFGDWLPVGIHYGRTVYKATPNAGEDEPTKTTLKLDTSKPMLRHTAGEDDDDTKKRIWLIFDPKETPPFALAAYSNEDQARDTAKAAARNAGDAEDSYIVQSILIDA